MTLTEAARKACECPTLPDALAWICVWECERAVRQALHNCRLEGDTIVVLRNTDAGGRGWDTCFMLCIGAVIMEWAREKKGLTEGLG